AVAVVGIRHGGDVDTGQVRGAVVHRVGRGREGDRLELLGLHALGLDGRVGVVLVDDHRSLLVGEGGDGLGALVELGVGGVDDLVLLHEVQVPQDAVDHAVLGEGGVPVGVVEGGAVLGGVDEGEVVVLRVGAGRQRHAVHIGVRIGQRLGGLDHLLPGGGRLEPGVLEHLDVVVHAVGQAVQRDRAGVGALGAAGGQRCGDVAVP